MEFIDALWEPVVAVLALLANWGLIELVRFVRQRTGNERMADAVRSIGDASIVAAVNTEKNIRPLFSDGKLDNTEKKELRKAAFYEFEKVVKPAAMDEMRKHIKDFRGYVMGKIDQAHDEVNKKK